MQVIFYLGYEQLGIWQSMSCVPRVGDHVQSVDLDLKYEFLEKFKVIEVVWVSDMTVRIELEKL